MENKVIIALDEGTSSARAAAFDYDGQRLFLQSAPIHVNARHNTCTCDGAALLKAQLKVLDEAIATMQGDANDIEAIAVSAQRSTVVLWDKHTGNPLCPVLTWLDGRAADIIDNLAMSHEDIFKKTGLYKTPYFSAPKIKWCIDNYPEIEDALKEGRLLAGPVSSFLIWHMTKGKVFAVDTTCAQRMLLLNINTLKWDEDLLKAFSIPRAILPEIKNTVDNYGTYKNIPIKVSCGDQQAATAPLLERQGSCVINYGTGAFLLLNIGPKVKYVKGILTSLAPSKKNGGAQYLLEGNLNTAGAFFAWLKQLGVDFDITRLDKAFENSQIPAWVLPALGGLGAPYWDFSVSPVISGLTPKSTRDDIICGAARGINFLLADIYFYLQKEGCKAEDVYASGGLSESKKLISFQSDVLGQDIIRCKQKEAALKGAAFLAAGNKAEGFNMLGFGKEDFFTPSLSAEKSAALYARWRKFVAFALQSPPAELRPPSPKDDEGEKTKAKRVKEKASLK